MSKLNLEEVTTLLKTNGINFVSKKLKIKKNDIYNLLKNNGLEYVNLQVKPIDFNNTKVIQQDINKEISVTKDDDIQKSYYDIDMNELKELLSLKDDLKQLIQQYHISKNVIDVEPIELKVKAITEVKQRLFKIDVEVLEKWDKFIASNKQFKVQQLSSLALLEFIEKYS